MRGWAQAGTPAPSAPPDLHAPQGGGPPSGTTASGRRCSGRSSPWSSCSCSPGGRRSSPSAWCSSSCSTSSTRSQVRLSGGEGPRVRPPRGRPLGRPTLSPAQGPGSGPRKAHTSLLAFPGHPGPRRARPGLLRVAPGVHTPGLGVAESWLAAGREARHGPCAGVSECMPAGMLG